MIACSEAFEDNVDVTAGTAVTVVVVSADDDYVTLVDGWLRDVHPGVDVVALASAAAVADWAGRADLVVCDLVLPDSQGLGTMQLAAEAFGDVPIVAVSTFLDGVLERFVRQAGAIGTARRGDGDRDVIVRAVRQLEGPPCEETAVPALTGWPQLDCVVDEIQQAADAAVFVVFCESMLDVVTRDGWRAAEQFAAAFTRRLQSTVTDGDVTWHGGGMFAVAAPCSTEPDLAAYAIVSATRRTFTPAGGAPIQAISYVGWAAGRDVSGQELLRRATIASAAARDTGQWVAGFEPERDHRRYERAAARLAASEMIRQGTVDVALHPMVEFATGRVAGLEVLVRGLVGGRSISAGEMLAAAVDAGMANQLTSLVLDRVTEIAPTMRKPGLLFGVHVSSHQLTEEAVVRRLLFAQTKLRRSGYHLALEVTDLAARDQDRLADSLRQLDDAGVLCALDRFDAGFAALAACRDLPVAAVKIDTSMLRLAAAPVSATGPCPTGRLVPSRAGNDVPDPRSSTLGALRSTVDFLTAVGVSAIVTGIESDADLELAVQANCEIGQGFRWCKPLDPADAAGYVQSAGSFWDPPAPTAEGAAASG